MCSFLITNKKITDLDVINKKLKRRGPDNTSVLHHNDMTIIHNLLHITGEKTLQPIIQNNTLLLYNGEVYNYKGKSDTEYVFNEINTFGPGVIKFFDGEFAIATLINNELILATDMFGSKPLFYSKDNICFGASSYYSVLKELGFTNINKLSPNTIFNLSRDEKIPSSEFNLEQTIETFDDWEHSFLRSVSKRITDKSFLCLSSGYDSGAIALAAKLLRKDLTLFCVSSKENVEIIKKREEFLGPINYMEINDADILKHNSLIHALCDNYSFPDYNFLQDRASLGLSVIFEAAKKRGLNVNISGSGADEIFSDYGIKGRSVFWRDNTSTLKGIFPESLKGVFPWNNFYEGRQSRYLYKEESVAGCHGIETRYPFLDIHQVQAFLNTSSKIKNAEYKAPLTHFFKKYDFPFERDVKRGFNV